MLRFRPRFSLKLMLVAVALVAAGSYLLMLPTMRARRFAGFVNSGQLEMAVAMVTESSKAGQIQRDMLKRASGAALTPLTFKQLMHGERLVRVTSELEGIYLKTRESAATDFSVRRTTVVPGWYSLLDW